MDAFEIAVGIAGILAFLWVVFFGQKTIGEAIASSKAKKSFKKAQRRAELDYLREVIERFEEWDKYYISMRFRIIDEPSITVPDEMRDKFKQDKELSDNELSLVKRYPQVLLFGDAGSGKTTISQKIVLEIARQSINDENGEIPIFIRLADFTKGMDFDEFIIQHTKEHYPSLGVYVSGLLKQRKIYLFLDSVDEIPAPFLEKSIEILQSYLSQNKDLKLIITSRKSEMEKLSKFDIRRIEIQPLQQNQIADFVRAYLSKNPEEMLSDIKSTGWMDYQYKPYTLRLLTLYFEATKHLPDSSTNVIGDIVDIFIKEEMNKNESGEEILVLREALAHLALAMGLYGLRGTCVSTEWIIKQTPPIINNKLIDWKRVLNIASNANLLKVDFPGNKVRFAHQLYHEYFRNLYSWKNLFIEKVIGVNSGISADSIAMLEQAYEIADDAYQGIPRASNDPYIFHGIAAAVVTAKYIEPGHSEFIAIALFHDIPIYDEKRKTCFMEEVIKFLGHEKAAIIDDFRKTHEAIDNSKNISGQSIDVLISKYSREMLLAKLAESLHNFETIRFLPPEKQKKHIMRAHNFYISLAKRLNYPELANDFERLLIEANVVEPEAVR